MRPAPAVTVQMPADAAWTLASAVLGAVAAGGLGALLASHFEHSRTWAWWATTAAAAIAAWLMPRLVPAGGGRLRWDGAEHWWFSPCADGAGECCGRVAVALDLDGWLLLRFFPSEPAGGRASWLPLRETRLGAAAHGLRAAVYSRRFSPDDQLPRRGPEPE